MISLYGINNCDTIKKSKKWLDEQAINYEFHDYKKHGVPEAELKKWVKQLGWEALLNKRGTTWRKLDDATKESVNEVTAIKIMLDNPSIIKRPVLKFKDQYFVGFKADEYTQLFNDN